MRGSLETFCTGFGRSNIFPFFKDPSIWKISGTVCLCEWNTNVHNYTNLKFIINKWNTSFFFLLVTWLEFTTSKVSIVSTFLYAMGSSYEFTIVKNNKSYNYKFTKLYFLFSRFFCRFFIIYNFIKMKGLCQSDSASLMRHG